MLLVILGNVADGESFMLIHLQPKTTANAFQRVKADEVQFADDRLQDNSYWAKV